MHRIDDPSAVSSLPTPDQPGTPGFFTSSSPTTGQQATIVTDDWANAVQEELSYVIEQSGITLSKTDRTQLYQAIGKLTRIRLIADTTFYLSPTGNDASDGLTQATAWASINHAYNYVRDHVDINGHQIVIQMANGTYSAGGCGFPIVGPAVILRGNQADPSQVIVNNPTGPAIVAVNSAIIAVDSFTVQASGPAGDYGAVGAGLITAQNGQIIQTNMRFGACSEAHMDSRNGGIITMGAIGKNYTIAGSANYHMAALGGYIATADSAISLAPGLNFSGAYAYTDVGGELDAWNCTFTGTATGPRYLANRNGIIVVNNAGPNYFPGSQPGSVALGGIYQ